MKSCHSRTFANICIYCTVWHLLICVLSPINPLKSMCAHVCSRGHNDVEILISIEDVVSEVAAVLHRSWMCVQIDKISWLSYMVLSHDEKWITRLKIISRNQRREKFHSEKMKEEFYHNTPGRWDLDTTASALWPSYLRQRMKYV